MGNSAYLATETMSAVIILILLYANNFEIKEHSLKRNLFNRLLIINEIIVVADAITFIPLDWEKMPFVFFALITATYTLTPLIKLYFTSYLYVYISARAPISAKLFTYMKIFCWAELIITFFLCITQKLFYVQDGVFYSGSMESVYLVLSLFSVLLFLIIVSRNAKKLGIHDTIAVLPICLIPIFSMAVIIFTGINLSVTMISFTMLILYITIQSEHESNLFKRANVDELTGLFNRAAYANEVKELSKSADDSLVYASIDLNGLKAVNDSLGHVAGDELIKGAADCLKKAFAGSGKIFRMGGDEFAAIFFADGYSYKLETIKGALEAATKMWKGKRVESLTLSVGYATKREFPDEEIVGLAKIADKRMYAEKSRFYATKGVDRRGQNNAYKALSSLYTKILKINITDGSFTVIDMFSDEQTQEKGYSESIFEWLTGFAKSGQVHPDDVEDFLANTDSEYMRNYFKSGNHLLTFTYRRKYEDEFKQAIMEIIPTNEYTNDDQSLYLYVKSIG